MKFVCRTFTAPDFAVDFGTAMLRISGSASHVVEVSSRIDARWPLRGGVIVDDEAAADLLRAALQPLRTWHARRPRVLATIPGDASERECIALSSALYRAGAGRVALVPEPAAAAAGIDLVGSTKSLWMILDVGEGITELAVVSGRTVLHRFSIRLGCSDMHESIMSADAAISTIASFVGTSYRDLSPRLRARLADSGLCLTGGGALIHPLQEAVESQLDVPVFVADDPLRSVIVGARKLLDREVDDVWENFSDHAV